MPWKLTYAVYEVGHSIGKEGVSFAGSHSHITEIPAKQLIPIRAAITAPTPTLREPDTRATYQFCRCLLTTYGSDSHRAG